MSYGYNVFYAEEDKLKANNLNVTSDGRYFLGDPLGKTPLETDRLIIRESTGKDLPGLVEVYMSCSYMKCYTGHDHKPEDVRKTLEDGDPPPGGHPAFFHTKTIQRKEDGKIVALLEYYLGYPKPNTLWVSSLLIHGDVQREGFGTELMNAFVDNLDRIHLTMVSIGVYEKNTKAMAFWKKMGFTADQAHEVKGGVVKLDDPL